MKCSVFQIEDVIDSEFSAHDMIVFATLLPGGLFFYDIFWVFGTKVMVTVAKSFEAPIKLVFPQDLLENGLGATNMAMLGLGDIVIPGQFSERDMGSNYIQCCVKSNSFSIPIQAL